MYKKAFELSYKNKKVEIEIQDFVGDVRNINGTEDLFSLSYISDSKDKGQSILVTEADINFYADDYFNIDELKTVGETDIKVKYYEDDSLLWSGFVIPDFFSTSVDIAPVVSMVATDRVGTLKEISNNAESNIPIQILASCLKQTGQDLPINLIADNNHFETPIQLERIEEIASYDVIRSFMVLFNCKITLYKNAWWIINKKLLESGFVNYKSYNSDGAGGSVTPFAQPILDIDLVDRDGQREIKPTASEVSLFLEFGGSKKYPKNWDFEEWSGTTFKGWTNHNGFTQSLNTKNIDGYTFAYPSPTTVIYGSDSEFKSMLNFNEGPRYSKGVEYITKPHTRSPLSPIKFVEGKAEIDAMFDFTGPQGSYMFMLPVIKANNKVYAFDGNGELQPAGTDASITLKGILPIAVRIDMADVGTVGQTIWKGKFSLKLSELGVDEDSAVSIQYFIFGSEYGVGNPTVYRKTQFFINRVEFEFNNSQVTGKGLIFKIKQGGEKFSKSREPETILFSDKINQGVNGYFYNYKYDDTSIVDLPSEFALSSVRERADMFSKARDYYSLDGDFIVNPLAKYVCGLKSFVLIGGQNRREDASIIVEEIVSNTLNRTDFIYTYFDDGKDKVKSIGTASGGSSSGGGGGSSPSTPQLIKEDEEGNYYSEQPFYSLGGLSAFGFSEVGDDTGGGGIINVIDNLTSTSKTDPLSANQGRYLKTLIDNIEVGEGGQVIVDWEAITGKPSTFTPSAHTHIIGDVTGLQSALDGKASLSQLGDKEDKFTKNSAFNKNFGTGLNDVARGNHTHTFASLTSKPTTLGGYGITDGANKVHTHAISDVTNLQTELNKKATNTALTTHVNKTDNPHSVTKSQVGLGNVANKDLSNVDNIQQATKTEFTSHKNLFDSMFRKVGTNIEAKLSLYSLGGLSAYGFSEEGSETGGGIVNILPSWESYTSDKSGWALSAGLGVDLNSRKADKTWVESLLEDYVPTDTKYTAGRGLTLTGTVFSTSFDIANYATVTALGGKVDKVAGKSLISDTEIARLANVTNQTRASLNITNVDNTSDANKPISSATQTALNSKLATSIFNTHNTDNIRHITGVERTKWDTVVTDFAELEIGGRNLLLNTSLEQESESSNSSTNNIQFLLTEPLKIGAYIISFYARTTTGTDTFYISARNGGSNVSTKVSSSVIGAVPEEYSYYEFKLNISTSDEIADRFTFTNRVQNNANNTGTLYVKRAKLEKGNKATDWTPAPEDQVSDWLTTDINSFSFIKNKPTLLSQFTDNIGVATHIANKTNPHSVTKAQVGLGNVDNTSDLLKPISTATQNALALKLNKLTFDDLFEKVETSAGKWAVKVKYNLFSVGEISAFGAGDSEGGGGGGSMDMMQGWAFTTATENYYLPAKLAVPFYNDTRDRLSTLEGGSATTVNVSGTGDLLASVSKVGNNVNFIKGNQSWNNLSGKPSTFAPSAHTHPISDITNLQTTLADKLEATVFDTHNNDNVRHITGAERTKWDDAFNRGDFREFGLGADYLIRDLDEQKNNSIGYAASITANRTMPYGGVFRFGSEKSYVQLYGEYESKQDLHFRRNRNGVFDDWRKLWHDGNLTSLSQLTDNIGVATHIANSVIHITGQERINWNLAYSERHTHPNKSVIDQLTQADINVLAKLSIVDGNLRIDANTYSTGELSAFGLGEEGEGGGGSMNMMQDWTIPTGTENYYLPAQLAVPFYNDTRDRLTVLEAGTAPLAHIHAIADVTGLQTALNSKLETSIFDTHNTDNIRHITGAERTKWDGVVTDFAELEIGGRNYLRHYKALPSSPNASYFEDDTKGTVILTSRQPSFWYNKFTTSIQTGTKVTFSISCRTLNGITRITQYFNAQDGYLSVGTATTEWQILKLSRTLQGDIKTTDVLHLGGIPTEGLLIEYVQLEIGNKASSGQPAPEDQVSDWLTTDVNSFSFIKNKPTMLSQFIDNIGVATHITNKSNPHSVTKAQVGLGNVDNIQQATKVEFMTQKALFDTMFRKTSTNEIEAKLSLYTLGGLSAYGFSDEGSSGGGGGIVNILSDWTKYDASKSGWALGAGLGKGLYDNKADKTDPRFTDARTPLSHTHIISDVTGLQTALNAKTNQTFSDGLNTRLTSVEDGSATTVNVSGTGDLLASVSKVGNNINFIKGNQSWGNLSGKPSAFAPSAHTHPISDITNLQTTLNNKLETSIFNTHNNDNVRHITGVERTKWNTVVTDFAGLEIGGRNLMALSNLKKTVGYRATTPLTSNEVVDGRTVKILSQIGAGIGTIIYREDINKPFLFLSFKTNLRLSVIKASLTLVDEENATIKTTVFDFYPIYDGYYEAKVDIGSLNFKEIHTAFFWSGHTSGLTYPILFTDPLLVNTNIPTDWTPAPEDQVSDWLTTDVNSFSYIKNKPTLLSQFTDNIGVATHIANNSNPHSVTKAQVGLGNVTNESKATMFTNPTFTGTTKVTILELNSNWKVLKSGNELEFRYNNVKKATLTPNGDLIVMGGMTAYQ